MYAFILEGLGSAELLLILVVALIFFGPRKLPQLARSMGKGLTEFRKASDDFKRTWEREVALETPQVEEHSLLESAEQSTYEPAQSFAQPVVETPDSELVVARENPGETASKPLPQAEEVPVETAPVEVTQAEPLPIRKQEWL